MRVGCFKFHCSSAQIDLENELRYMRNAVTVAILAQGTSWAVAVTQAYCFPQRTDVFRARVVEL